MAKHEPREMEHAATVMAAVPRDSWGQSVLETWVRVPGSASRPFWSPGIPNLLGSEVPNMTSTTARVLPEVGLWALRGQSGWLEARGAGAQPCCRDLSPGPATTLQICGTGFTYSAWKDLKGL